MCNKLKEISVAVNATQLIITVPVTEFTNYKRYILQACSFLPQIIGTEQVLIKSDLNLYPLLDKAGNIVRAGRFLKRGNYYIQFGADGILSTPHFVVLSDLPCKIYYNPVAVLEPNTKKEEPIKEDK